MSRDIILLLAGAGIALVSSLVTALVQHLLSIRAEKIKRMWEKQEKSSEELRNRLTEGTNIQLSSVKRRLLQKEGIRGVGGESNNRIVRVYSPNEDINAIDAKIEKLFKEREKLISEEE